MTAQAETVAAYLRGLPHERRGTVETIRSVVLAHLPPGYEETIQNGMLSYVVPPRRFAVSDQQALAYLLLDAREDGCALYLMCCYGDAETARWFVQAYRESGRPMDLSQWCLRFQTLDDLPLDLIGALVGRTDVDTFIRRYHTDSEKFRTFRNFSERTRGGKRYGFRGTSSPERFLRSVRNKAESVSGVRAALRGGQPAFLTSG